MRRDKINHYMKTNHTYTYKGKCVQFHSHKMFILRQAHVTTVCTAVTTLDTSPLQAQNQHQLQ